MQSGNANLITVPTIAEAEMKVMVWIALALCFAAAIAPPQAVTFFLVMAGMITLPIQLIFQNWQSLWLDSQR